MALEDFTEIQLAEATASLERTIEKVNELIDVLNVVVEELKGDLEELPLEEWQERTKQQYYTVALRRLLWI